MPKEHQTQHTPASTSHATADNIGAASISRPARQTNNTGLPDNIKTGIEQLSGISLDDVKVHYNSSKPAQLQARAYAEGTNIYIGNGHEKHLAHEAWHVIQQKQGRVQPNLQLKGAALNVDPFLEQEADQMGAKAVQIPPTNVATTLLPLSTPAIQRKVIQANGILDAFNAGAKIVAAGETHDFLPKGEEYQVWNKHQKKLLYEFEAVDTKEGEQQKNVRLDSPYLRLVYAAQSFCDHLAYLEEWARDNNKENQKKWLDIQEIEFKNAPLEFQHFNEEWLGNNQLKTAPKYRKAELLLTYITTIFPDLMKFYNYNNFEKQLKGYKELQSVYINKEMLANEVKQALTLDGFAGTEAGDISLVRSKKMMQNLRKWAPLVQTQTVWKIGEKHIVDFDTLTSQGQTLPPDVVYMHEDDYKAAYLDLLRPIRTAESVKFILTL